MLMVLILVLMCAVPSTRAVRNLYHGPTSVDYDSASNRYFIPNFTSGQIVALDEYKSQSYFAAGLDSVLGNHLEGNILYATYHYGVRGFDITTGETVMDVALPIAGYHDGITADTSGNLYVINSLQRIYKIHIATEAVSTFVQGQLGDGFGEDITFDPHHNRLLVVSMDTNDPIRGVWVSDSTVHTVVGTELGPFNAVCMDDKRNTYIGLFNGQVWRFDSLYTSPPTLVLTFADGCDQVDYNTNGDILVDPHYGASRIDFASPFMEMDANTTWGHDSLTVAFSAAPRMGMSADAWLWDFGDGDSAAVQSPTHTYHGAGTYDVTCHMTVGSEVLSYRQEHMIAVLDDYLIGNAVEGNSGATVEVVVDAVNTIPLYLLEIPVDYSGVLGLRYLGYSTAGCRTENFALTEITYHDSAAGLIEFALDVDGGLSLPPGSGPVLKLQFQITAGSQGQTVNPVSPGGFPDHQPRFEGFKASYQPDRIEGSVTLIGCCYGVTGNIDDDPEQSVDVGDLTTLIDHLFISFPDLACVLEADIAPAISGGAPDGTVDVGDLTALIDHLFITFPALPACP